MIYIYIYIYMEKYDIVKFVDDDFEIDVRADKENETVWLNQEEMSELFGVDRTRITRHINNIYIMKRNWTKIARVRQTHIWVL